MRTHRYQITTSLSAARLYHAMHEVSRWPEWDTEVEWTRTNGPILEGSTFTLKPKGGPAVNCTVVTAQEPHSLVDETRLFLGRLRFSHQFTPITGGTRIDLALTTSGPLAFLWDRIIARKIAAGFADQTRRFLAFAGDAA